MAELVYDPAMLPPGERVYVLRVGMALPSETILASLTMDLVTPLDEEDLRHEQFTGFEQRAGDLVQRAKMCASEQGVRHIVVVDPYGLLRLASPRRGRS